jgi:hypothetical protein
LAKQLPRGRQARRQRTLRNVEECCRFLRIESFQLDEHEGFALQKGKLQHGGTNAMPVLTPCHDILGAGTGTWWFALYGARQTEAPPERPPVLVGVIGSHAVQPAADLGDVSQLASSTVGDNKHFLHQIVDMGARTREPLNDAQQKWRVLREQRTDVDNIYSVVVLRRAGYGGEVFRSFHMKSLPVDADLLTADVATPSSGG